MRKDDFDLEHFNTVMKAVISILVALILIIGCKGSMGFIPDSTSFACSGSDCRMDLEIYREPVTDRRNI